MKKNLLIYSLLLVIILITGGISFANEFLSHKTELASSPLPEVIENSPLGDKKGVGFNIIAFAAIIIGVILLVKYGGFNPPSDTVPAADLVIRELGNQVDTLDKIIENHVETILKQSSVNFNKIQESISRLRAGAFYKQSVGTIDGGSNLPPGFSFRKNGE